MLYINIIAILTVVMFFLGYRYYLNGKALISVGGTGIQTSNILWLLVMCFFIRILIAILYTGFPTDMNCFYAWSLRVHETGFSGFYTKEVFTDYPPGYIYVLYILGFFLKLFKTTYYGDVMSIIILKLPAILCDLAIAYVIFKIARKRFKEDTSLVCALLYLFNPSVVMNSTIWGQVDSVYTLCIVAMCYYLIEHKYNRAIIIYAIGVIMKPQMLIFTPVLLFACIEKSFISYRRGKAKFEFDSSNFLYLLSWSGIGIAIIALSFLPFGFKAVIEQYMDTLGSYTYASVNAYNMWTFFGLNWVDQSKTFLGIPYVVYGNLAIVLTVVFSGIIYFKSKREDSRVYLTGAFISIFMFLFAVRMHERYMFPAIVLLFLTFLVRPNKKMFFMYTLFSVVHFYNVAHVLFYFDVNNYDWEALLPKTIAFATLALFALFSWLIWKYYVKRSHDKEYEEEEPLVLATYMKEEEKIPVDPIMKSEEKIRLNKKDYLIMLAITLVYAAVALYNLGYNYAPETSYQSFEQNSEMIFDFGESKQIAKLSGYLGSYEDRKVNIFYKNSETEEWKQLTTKDGFKFTSVFKWNSIQLDVETRYLKIVSTTEKIVLNELVFLDYEGNKIEPVNKGDYESLFDEQSMYEPMESYRSGTYFDEIYHARTAYEFMNGLYTYEWTHPPLGKIIIAIGMSIFGVNPFGWRIMGTLFGIGMLPLIYVFGRKFFKKTWLAAAVCFMFATDFMHFAQTRIATIDVFVTFFILLMYYFMYQYTRASFYDTKLYKTFIPLGLCGITMGLSIATKMTGVYAAVGLAVIFFINLYKRYKEYVYAKENPNGITGDISHDYVVNNFWKLTFKTIGFCVLVFIIIPAIIYTLSYIPFVKTEGMGLIERMLDNQEMMFNYHAFLVAEHPFASEWYKWPIMYRPIWYYSGEVSKTVAEGISAFGNPAIWWIGIPAFFYMAYLTVKRRDKLGVFLIIGYMAQYLPWMLVARLTYIYHYFPSVPFVIMMIAYCMKDLAARGKGYRRGIVLYLTICLVLFVMFYPVLSGMPVYKDYVSNFLRWFDSWVLLLS